MRHHFGFPLMKGTHFTSLFLIMLTTTLPVSSFAIAVVLRNNRPKKGEYPLYMRLTLEGARTEFSTQLYVKLSDWDKQRNQVKGNGARAKAVNEALANLEVKARTTYHKLASANKPFTVGNLKEVMLGLDQKQFGLVHEYRASMAQSRERVGRDYSINSWKVNLKTCNHLENYISRKFNRADIYLADLDYDVIKGFEHYMITEADNCINSTARHIERIKAVINQCIKRGILDKDPFAMHSLKKEKVEVGFLNEAELQLLQNKDFGIERLNYVRDIFLFSCYTGLAYVDIKGLHRSHIQPGKDGQLWIIKAREKTGTISRIPLLPPAQVLLASYENHPTLERNGALLPVISNQKLNAYLKEIADLTGITKRLTMHIGRHTFATTVTLSNNVPIETVSKMLGHTNLKTTQIYAKVVETKIASDMEHVRQLYGKKV
jgi:site-specific recombinase XerD